MYSRGNQTGCVSIFKVLEENFDACFCVDRCLWIFVCTRMAICLQMCLHTHSQASSHQFICIVWVVSQDYHVSISSALRSQFFTWVVSIESQVFMFAWKHFDKQAISPALYLLFLKVSWYINTGWRGRTLNLLQGREP